MSRPAPWQTRNHLDVGRRLIGESGICIIGRMDHPIQRLPNICKDFEGDLVGTPAPEAEETRIGHLFQLVCSGLAIAFKLLAWVGFISGKVLACVSEVSAFDLVRLSTRLGVVANVFRDRTIVQVRNELSGSVIGEADPESIPEFSLAWCEVTRIAWHELVIRAPFCQNTRVGHPGHSHCAKNNLPWDYVTKFDSDRSIDLSSRLGRIKTVFWGASKERGNLRANPARVRSSLIQARRRRVRYRITFGIASA